MIKTQNNEIEVLNPKMQGEGAEAKNGTLVKNVWKEEKYRLWHETEHPL